MMQPSMLPDHERVLREAYCNNKKTGAFSYPWGRITPHTWRESLNKYGFSPTSAAAFPSAEGFSDKILTRQKLRDKLSATGDTKLSVLLVLAWGEMSPRNARPFLEADDGPWLGLISCLRDGKLNRQEAYTAFRYLADERKIPGLGPAYFSKLIYFLSDQDPNAKGAGFIMDRWTATSINLLFGCKIVKMDQAKSGKSYVSRRNDAKNYECFCYLIEHIADQWSAPPEHIEMTLFGCAPKSGDRLWRNHVNSTLSGSR